MRESKETESRVPLYDTSALGWMDVRARHDATQSEVDRCAWLQEAHLFLVQYLESNSAFSSLSPEEKQDLHQAAILELLREYDRTLRYRIKPGFKEDLWARKLAAREVRRANDRRRNALGYGRTFLSGAKLEEAHCDEGPHPDEYYRTAVRLLVEEQMRLGNIAAKVALLVSQGDTWKEAAGKCGLKEGTARHMVKCDFAAMVSDRLGGHIAPDPPPDSGDARAGPDPPWERFPAWLRKPRS